MIGIVAENYLCLFALVEMILKDIGKSDFDQYELAEYFGITVPLDYVSDRINHVVHSCVEREWGTNISEKQLNEFFDINNIPLKAKFLTANPYNAYDEVESVSEKQYIIYLYSYGSLNHEPVNYDVGHASLLIGFLNNDKVRIYDPGPRNAGIKEVSVNSLYDAIYDNRGGIVIIEGK